jgi:pimeloyl-ACP methyl ester carboxylesterase
MQDKEDFSYFVKNKGLDVQQMDILEESVSFGGMHLTSLQFSVPLDWNSPDPGETINLFVRKVNAVGNEGKNLPYLLYLQGGPGFQSPRPEGRYGWLKRATEEYQVLLLDQRGTGLSSPVTHQTLSIFPTTGEAAQYFTYFRADSIVRDCEFIREKLLGRDGRWVILGQSFGGFCAATYLSFAPSGLAGVIFSGGLPPVAFSCPDQIYRYTFAKVLEYNVKYYQRYPEDVKRVKAIAFYLKNHRVLLPGGGVLSVRRFQQLGLGFGLGTFERVHYLIESAFVRLQRPSVGITAKLSPFVGEDVISYTFLRGIENMLEFETNPIYAVLHESIYCQGAASNWSAERILKEFPVFSPNFQDDSPIFFTGEMVFSWMFDDYKYLQSIQLAAEMLAKKTDWPSLYSLEQLANNEVPAVAIVYHDDMYVPYQLSEESAHLIQGLRLWSTSEYSHSAIHSGGEVILHRLLGMLNECKHKAHCTYS